MVYVYTRPRVEIMAMTKSPGPAVYKMPGLTGTNDHDPHSRFSRGPAHTFGGRRDTWAIGCGPGPCYYPSPKIYRDGHDGTPHYSLYARQKEMTMSQTPGPGAYCPESAGPTTKFRNPEYSFGTRLQHQRLDAVPGECSTDQPPFHNSSTLESPSPLCLLTTSNIVSIDAHNLDMRSKTKDHSLRFAFCSSFFS